ncbi:hypothetical protein [Neolewinella agarilytica]|uniref:hypothetical protein n=1 Tax=Neolewinella agarilytica TaxID=478744 RepID=UPI0023578052|nr:hypothetical protein [Neolewinella agarilytica]
MMIFLFLSCDEIVKERKRIVKERNRAFVLFNNSNISGEIQESYMSGGVYFMVDSVSYFFFPTHQVTGKDFSFFDLEEDGDSIVKKSFSDTLNVVLKDKTRVGFKFRKEF